LISSLRAFCFSAFYLLTGPVVRNSANSVELLILRDDPRLWSKRSRWLFYDASANWRRPKGDRVTSLCHSNEVLPPILAEENPSSPWSKLAKSRPLTGTLICSFIVCFFPFFFNVELKLRALLDDRQVT
jgi:hypothetical protein